MLDSTQDLQSASRPLETSAASGRSCSQISAPPPPPFLHHGSPGIVDYALAASLPPTVTPATTTRQAISLGVLSTLWGSSNTPIVGTVDAQHDTIPAIITHAPSPETQDPPYDLTASTGSVPSTTTTLTNTLPPTQSAALRALNAPAFQSHASSNPNSKSAKSTSSRTTLSSQPVVVRTYSGSRHTSRPSSGLNTPRLFPDMSGHTMQQSPSSVLTTGLVGRSNRLPSVDDFSFSAILRAVDPEIRDAIDAIAEICARSRLSLADEYDAHLPPQGEITDTWGAGVGALIGRGRISRVGHGWTAADNTLTAVPEASSSSERLAGSGTAGSKERSRSAYGSLKSVISGGSGGSGKRKAVDPEIFQPVQQKPQGPAWAINHPAITLIASPQASKQLSLDISSTIKDIPESPVGKAEPALSSPQQPLHRRHQSATSVPHPHSRERSSTLTSLASWLPWPRPSDLDAGSVQALTKAESRLREMLILSQTSSHGKGKAPLHVT